MQLAGFQRISLTPGEEKTVSFELSSAQLRMLNKDMQWVVEPGVFRVMVGASSKDIRLRGELAVRP
jgi:beta-glucosidase